MARKPLLPKGNEESIESRAVADEAKFKSLLDRAANGDADALEELEARVMIPTSHPFTTYPIERLKNDKLENGRRTHKHIAEIAMTNVGPHLAEARRRARMGQDDAAQELGMSAKTLRRIETGQKVPSLELVLEMSCLYGTHVERVLGFIDAGAEKLLDLYEASTPRNRRDMIEIAGLMQSGSDRVPRSEQNIEADRTERMKLVRHRITET